MPSYKNHHYVPRAHFAPFSLDGQAKAINLFNLRAGRCIQNASVSSQCSKNYFYGEAGDTVLEDHLRELEGRYASTVRRLVSGATQPNLDDMLLLKLFAIVQWSRTDMAVQRLRETGKLMHSAANEGLTSEARLPELDLTDRTIIKQSMRLAMSFMRGVADLKTALVVNRSSTLFITSDDPAVMTSRYYIQKLRRSDFGIGNTGIMLYLPLTPRLLFMCYDGGAYVAPSKIGRLLTINANSDAEALNDLQLLNAGSNVYFSDWSSGESVRTQFLSYASSRRVSRTQVHVLVSAGDTPSGKRFRVATAEERELPGEKLIHMQSRHFMPSRWMSKIQFRKPVRSFSNGSAAGEVRHREWMAGFETFTPTQNW